MRLARAHAVTATPTESTADDHPALAARTVRNVAWLGSAQALRQLAAIGTTVVLARFLQPGDYGMFAMTLFVSELAQLFVDFGIGSALVQRKTVDQRMLSTCFWINVGIGLAASALVVVSGPLASSYFKQPQLVQLLVVSALNLLVSAISVLPQTVLARQLSFGPIAMATTLGSFGGAAITIAMAMAGFGVWALVCQPLIGSSITLVYLVWRSGWWPSRVFDLESVRGVLGMSGHLLVGSVISHVTRNLPHLMLAPALGAAATGLLSMAMTIAWLPIAQFNAVAVRATYPAFALLQDSRERMRAAMFRALSIIMMVTLPVLAGLAVVAADLIPLVFGKQWQPAVPLVPLFCILSMVQCITALANSTILAQGRADLTMKLAVLQFPLMAATLYLTRPHGLQVASAGLALATATSILIGFILAIRLLNGSLSEVVAALWRPMAATLLMTAAMSAAAPALASPSVGPLLRVLALCLLGTVVCLTASYAFNRRTLLDFLGLLRGLLGKKASAAS